MHVYRKVECEIEKKSSLKSIQTKGKAVTGTTAFRTELKKYLKRVSQIFNRNSIIGFIGEHMKEKKKVRDELMKIALPKFLNLLPVNMTDG